MSLLLRDVMEAGRSVDEALGTLRSAPRGPASTTYVLSDKSRAMALVYACRAK